MAENWFDTLGLDNSADIPHYQKLESDVLTDGDYTPDVRAYALGLLLDFVITVGDILGIFFLFLSLVIDALP